LLLLPISAVRHRQPHILDLAKMKCYHDFHEWGNDIDNCSGKHLQAGIWLTTRNENPGRFSLFVFVQDCRVINPVAL
jgi:hypothetical protein